MVQIEYNMVVLLVCRLSAWKLPPPAMPDLKLTHQRMLVSVALLLGFSAPLNVRNVHEIYQIHQRSLTCHKSFPGFRAHG